MSPRSDHVLASLARHLARNYHRLDPRFVGGRVFFTVEDAGQAVARTLLLTGERPRLFTGHLAPQGPEVPFLHLRATPMQLEELFAGMLDPNHPSNAGVAIEGNSEPFYQAFGHCL